MRGTGEKVEQAPGRRGLGRCILGKDFLTLSIGNREEGDGEELGMCLKPWVNVLVGLSGNDWGRETSY